MSEADLSVVLNSLTHLLGPAFLLHFDVMLLKDIVNALLVLVKQVNPTATNLCSRPNQPVFPVTAFRLGPDPEEQHPTIAFVEKGKRIALWSTCRGDVVPRRKSAGLLAISMDPCCGS